MPTEYHFEDLDLREEPGLTAPQRVGFTGSTTCKCGNSDACCFCSTTVC